MTTHMNPFWEREVLEQERVQHDTEARAEDIVAIARQRAPKRTGAGAASIHAEPIEVAGINVGQRVSWDKEHDYMRFPEFGTEHQPAQGFLRGAAIAAGAVPGGHE